MRRAKSVDEYFEKAAGWRSELLRLRKILKHYKLDKMIITVRGAGYRFSSKPKKKKKGKN